VTGRVIDVKFLQLIKELQPIWVNLSGKFILVNSVQSLKAPVPIVVTVSGNCTVVNLDSLENI
jgi:hypothetical protein